MKAIRDNSFLGFRFSVGAKYNSDLIVFTALYYIYQHHQEEINLFGL